MANLNLNKVILAGRLTADPELKKTTNTNTSVCRFGIAINRRFNKNAEQQQVDYFNCTAWSATAEFISNYFRKGSSICISGRIQNNTWTDQQGNKRISTDVIVEDAYFVDSRGETSSRDFTPDSVPAAPAYSTQTAEPVKFDEADEDDLPF